jgi:hypothetical protein
MRCRQAVAAGRDRSWRYGWTAGYPAKTRLATWIADIAFGQPA